ncbi:MAG: MATE family efflux transporter [Gammaproteobacteria bacterium]|nr:MATE family efflux transporter [Gammaproteobacteria bacterium]
MGEGMTKDVEKLLGDPKRAIVLMMVPVIIAMTFQSLNSIINSVWVAGLGPSALAAVGLVFPVFFIIIAVGNGIGVGASQTVALHIGMGDKRGADKSAAQAIMLTIIASAIIAVVLGIFLRPLLMLMGGGNIIDECYEYALPIVVFSPIVMLSSLFSNLLRSEGAAKRSMFIQVLTACINLVIDPFFIYQPFGFGLGWGIAGAAAGTVVSMFIGLSVALYWFKVKNDTYLKISLKGFRFDRKIDRMIFRVGIPASLELMIISLVSIVMNIILIGAGGDDAVAIYTSSWRIISILMIPLMATGGAMVPVCAAAFGARRFDRVREAYRYTLKLVVIIMLAISIVTALTAQYMATIFTYTEATFHLRAEMVALLHFGCIFLPFASWGATASALFQSLGMGTKSLISTLVRNLVQIPLCIFLFSVGGNLGFIWLGVALGEIVGSLLAGLWGESILGNLMKHAEKYHPKEEKTV